MAKKIDFAKLCWTVMALGAVVFLTHSAYPRVRPLSLSGPR